MKKMLVVAAYPGYKGVPTGGGMTHYYYLSRFAENFDVTLITFAEDKEVDKIKKNANEKKINVIILSNKRNLKDKIINLESHYNIFNRNGRFVPNSMIQSVHQKLKDLKKKGYSPDIVVLEWTEMLLACSNIKKIFPIAKVVASEHDVTFLSKKRKYECETGIRKIVKKLDYKTMLRREINCLRQMDLIVTHNEKDKELLIKYKMDANSLFTIVPYYKKIDAQIDYSNRVQNLVFYGSMARPENYKSAIWFMDHVLDKLPGYTFIIVGNKPSQELIDKSRDKQNVILTGFVEDITPYFENALCFIAPLVLGAGIKIKVLEALSSGVPVLTNELGIEGIPATDNLNYIHCVTEQDYVQKIKEICENIAYREYIGKNGKRFVLNTLDYGISWEHYLDRLNKLIKSKE